MIGKPILQLDLVAKLLDRRAGIAKVVLTGEVYMERHGANTSRNLVRPDVLRRALSIKRNAHSPIGSEQATTIAANKVPPIPDGAFRLNLGNQHAGHRARLEVTIPIL